MRKWFSGLCAACALLLYAACTYGSEGSPLVVGPIVQDVQEDSFKIVFETARPVHAVVQAAGAAPAPAASDGTRHVVRVAGLGRGQRVPYQLIVDGKVVAGGTVTLADRARPLSFLVYGDTRDNEVGSALVTLAHSLAPDLILHTGDIVHLGYDVKYWYTFFHDEAPLLADVPLYPAPGNHDLARDPAGLMLQRFFALPEHAAQQLYYAFSFGPARFIVLDGNRPDATQTAWLAAQLAEAQSNGVAHVFVLLHQPPFSMGQHCGDGIAQADWVQLFERYRVRAVFAGHDHAYERLERNGVRYFVSGGGGAELYPEEQCAAFDRAARRVYRSVHHLLRVSVSGPSVSIEALPLDGSAPLEVIRAVAGEPMFAADAPPLRPAPPNVTTPWSVAGGCAAFLGLGLWLRRRRRRAR
jgi:hypothetical protein